MRIRNVTLLFIGALLFASGAAMSVVAATADDGDVGVSNDYCLGCHADPATTMTLENGASISLYIDPDVFEQSVHGAGGYACVQCHTEIRDYPHAPFSAYDARDLSLDLYDACFRCHSGQYERALDSVHADALENGTREAAICTDCHGAHDTPRLTDPFTDELLDSARVNVPVTCSQCHNAIYQKYRESVHGSSLTEDDNQDVPTCIDCHGVHDIGDPTTARFRLRSPTICSNCHTDETLMSKYGLSTQVLNTYVSDFHGTTVTIFQKVTPDSATNKAVCYDCHGIHDIRRVDDPEKGLQVRENLLARCQVCHPDATSEFSTSWLSHYIPSPEKNSLVYYVNLFYKILIPGVLGGMAVLVLLDASWQVRRRLSNSSLASPEEVPPTTPEDDEGYGGTVNERDTPESPGRAPEEAGELPSDQAPFRGNFDHGLEDERGEDPSAYE